MEERALAVRAADYVEHVSDLPFVALPREEIARLHGAIELLAVSTAELAQTSALPLCTFTLIHYNYRWLTFQRGLRSLGLRGKLSVGEGGAPAFLDGSFLSMARVETEQQVALGPSDWRLVGLLNQGGVALVYVARLRQRDLLDRYSADVYGNGDLQTARDEFDAWSRLLIEHLHAF